MTSWDQYQYSCKLQLKRAHLEKTSITLLHASHWTSYPTIFTYPSRQITEQVYKEIGKFSFSDILGAGTGDHHKAFSTCLSHPPNTVLTQVVEFWQLNSRFGIKCHPWTEKFIYISKHTSLTLATLFLFWANQNFCLVVMWNNGIKKNTYQMFFCIVLPCHFTYISKVCSTHLHEREIQLAPGKHDWRTKPEQWQCIECSSYLSHMKERIRAHFTET